MNYAGKLLSGLIFISSAALAQGGADDCGCRHGDIHAGQDWTAPEGTTIPVAYNGEVVEIGNYGDVSSVCGNYVVVRHIYPRTGKIVYTRYAQLGRIVGDSGKDIRLWSPIQAKAKIGEVGKKNVFHFEVRVTSSDKFSMPWYEIEPIDPATFDFSSGKILQAESFPWDQYPITDIDDVFRRDVKQHQGRGGGVDIFPPKRMRIAATLLSTPHACDTAFLRKALAFVGISYQNIPPISTCIQIKTPKGRRIQAYIQDQVGEFVTKEVKVGGQADLYVSYLYANTVSNTLGLIVNEFQIKKGNKE